jgi:hypothetical protein
MGNDRRTYSPAPPLRINLHTRENVYTGVATANHYWRNVLQTRFDYSPALKELLADAEYSRAQVLVEVHGYVENPNTPNDRRPYMQKFSTPVVFGKSQLSQALDAAIAVFKVSKKVTDAPGYVASGNIIVLTHAIIKLAYTEEGEGGGLSRADMVEITATDSETIIAANPPTSGSAYAKTVPNACLFRCLYHTLSNKKWFKSLGNVRTIKSSIGLGSEAYVPVSKAFQFCDMHGIELKLKIYDGSTFSDHVSPRHDTHRYKYRNINLILHIPMKHYMVYFAGRISKDPNAKGGRRSVCDRCNNEIDMKDAAAHYKAHEIADAETRHFQLPEAAPLREDEEDIEAYGIRYRDHFVNLMAEFVADTETKSILWFAGPGGCGKSHVIKTFIQEHEDLDVLCLSHTGVAAQNIGGRTIESYLSSLNRKDKSGLKLPDVLIIDEISMTSMRQFERINASFCELNPEHNLFGGVKVLIMGDFCQLEIISDAKQQQYPVLQSPIFLRYVVAVPMLYGFRYKDDPAFFDFLCRMRENRVDFESFAAQQWNFCTRKQLAEEFFPEDRPVFMARTNAVVNETAKLIQQHDVDHSGRTIHKVPHFIYEVSLSPDGGEEVPKSLNLSSLFQRQVKKASMKRVYTKMSTLFTKALVEESSKSVWTRDGDCQINTTQHEFYAGQRLLVTKNYCDQDRALMNGQEVSFVTADEHFLTVENKEGKELTIPMIWRGAFVDAQGVNMGLPRILVNREHCGAIVKHLHFTPIDLAQSELHHHLLGDRKPLRARHHRHNLPGLHRGTQVTVGATV